MGGELGGEEGAGQEGRGCRGKSMAKAQRGKACCRKCDRSRVARAAGREAGGAVVETATGRWAGARLGMLQCQGQAFVLFSEGPEGPWKCSEPERGRSHMYMSPKDAPVLHIMDRKG